MSSGASNDPGLTVVTLGSTVGRQTPILAVIVPLVLVFVVDGKRGVKQTWLSALVCGITFGLAQFVAANFISVPLADIFAALVSAAAVVVLLRAWQPSEVIAADAAEEKIPTQAGAPVPSAGSAGTSASGVGTGHHTGSDVTKAYAPYVVIIAIFSIANITAVKDFLAEKPFTFAFGWPGLEVLNAQGDPISSTVFDFNWLPAAGTLWSAPVSSPR